MTATPPRAKGDAPSKNMLSFKEKTVVYQRLQELLKPSTLDRAQFVYPEGVTDATVAAEMGFTCTEHNVAGVRKEMFGDLAKAITPEQETTLRLDRQERVLRFMIEHSALDADTRYELGEILNGNPAY